MTFPVQFRVLGLHVTAHQVLELAAYAAGFQLYLYLRRRWPQGPKLTPWQTAWIVIGAIFGALIGAKTLAWAESFPLYWAERTHWQILLGGKTIVGAMLGGWVGVELAKRRLRISHPSGDVDVFPVILGMCIGRIGCFLEGLPDHTCGIHTRLPWGVDFGDGPRHPTQLYEIGFLLALAGVFLWRIRTRRQRGCMFSQFVFGYLAFRLAVEFIKDRYTVPYIHLSAIQLAALAGMVYACFHWNDACCGAPATKVPGTTSVGSANGSAQVPIGGGEGTACAPGDEACCQKSAGTSAGPTFVELTNSLCPHCLTKVEAKVLIDGGSVYLQKFCPQHGSQRVLIAVDAAYWRRSRALNHRPPTPPRQCNTIMQRGCPWDCGLCPDHEQHTCVAIVEVTGQCDMRCPVCFASSTPQGQHRSLAEIEFMLDAAVATEGHLGIVQISGGEPALHPDLFAILDAVRARPVRHLMINTNGRRIAGDADFARRLASYMPGFEVYLQFDSLRPETLRKLRGVDVSAMRREAIDALNRHNLSTTLVVTLQKGINDQEIGELIDFALAQKCVRGLVFQPIQAAGRLNGFDASTHRLTLTEVRREILRQHKLFTPADLVPVPCHADALAMGYALRSGAAPGAMPLSKLIDPQQLADVGGNTICYEQDPELRERIRELLSRAASPAAAANCLGLECCLPLLPKGGSPIAYDKVFRVVIMQFMDAWSMDLRSLKRSCVHIVHPDGRLVPFETYNLLHRPKGTIVAADAQEQL